jgi:hypothetical protein
VAAAARKKPRRDACLSSRSSTNCSVRSASEHGDDAEVGIRMGRSVMAQIGLTWRTGAGIRSGSIDG